MRKLILLCVSFVFTMSAFAQAWDNAKPDKQFTFGIRAGANFSTFSGGFDPSGAVHYRSEFVQNKAKTSFHVGAVVDYNIIKSFAIETGLFYTDKGCKLNYDNARSYDTEYFSNAEDSVKLSYIQLPVLALVRLYVADDMHIQLKAGGYVAKRLGNSTAPFFLKQRDYDSYSDWDAGLIAGAGICYKNIYLGVQYELGLTKLLSYHGIKNRNLAISIGYDF